MKKQNGKLKKKVREYDIIKQNIDGRANYLTLDEAIAEYADAVSKGNTKRAEELSKIIQKGTEDSLKAQGINPKEVNALHNYIKDWNQTVIDAIKSGDHSTIGVTFKEMIRNAILEKLKGKIFDVKIRKLIDE